MKNIRYKIERKLDRYNHLMELIRTLTGLTVLVLQIILLLSLGSCNVNKRTKPCTQCPHYSLTEKQKLEYIKLNPFPTVLAYDYPIEDVELSPEFLEELRLNLIKTGVWIKDTINEK